MKVLELISSEGFGSSVLNRVTTTGGAGVVMILLLMTTPDGAGVVRGCTRSASPDVLRAMLFATPSCHASTIGASGALVSYLEAWMDILGSLCFGR